ncbi:DNA ligase [Ideonella sp.]|jgi:DNA ligase-1|uniref:DNA ligase n=1 Tax=Ideonella sp. TaxID=1929293 RepID=UPI0037BF200B
MHPSPWQPLWALLPLSMASSVAFAASAPALLLAKSAPSSIDPAGYLVSEKLDGVRAFWDGQRLRTRGGLLIAAPTWFTQKLPAMALDGELWMGRSRFDLLSGAVRQAEPDEAAWRLISFRVFEMPGAAGPFEQRAQRLRQVVEQAQFGGLQWVPQEVIADRSTLQRRLAEVVAAGGEGLMLHKADAPYTTGRSDVLLKLKPVEDAEAVVIGYEPGKGRFAGQTGALKVRDEQGRVFSVGSGLSHAQRISPPPLGSTVTVRWRGTTSKGLPRFATLWRLREPGY